MSPAVIAPTPMVSDAVKNDIGSPAKSRPHIQSENFEDSGLLMRQVVPADNSCLFTSVGFVLNGTI